MAREILTGERGERSNCLHCASILYLPSDVPDNYGGELDYTFDCPRCRSVYAAMSASAGAVTFELAVVQNEHKGKRRATAPKAKKLRDPIFGPVTRAQERLAAAEEAIADGMLYAHEEHGQSVREIASKTGYKKSKVHDLIVSARERRDRPRRRPAKSGATAPFVPIENDLIPF